MTNWTFRPANCGSSSVAASADTTAKDITAHLGTQDFWRLRIGIGHPGDRSEVVNFVLKPPRRDERDLIETAIDRAIIAWPAIARGDWNAAMQKLNGKLAKPAGLDTQEGNS